LRWQNGKFPFKLTSQQKFNLLWQKLAAAAAATPEEKQSGASCRLLIRHVCVRATATRQRGWSELSVATPTATGAGANNNNNYNNNNNNDNNNNLRVHAKIQVLRHRFPSCTENVVKCRVVLCI